MVSPSPPIFVHADDLLIFDSVEDAESWLEPVDVEPGEVAYDIEGRLLQVVVQGEVRRTGSSIDQSGARVELVLVEDQVRLGRPRARTPPSPGPWSRGWTGRRSDGARVDVGCGADD